MNVKLTIFGVATVGLAVLFAAKAAATPDNPPNARTGAFAIPPIPAETNCTACHSGNSLNESTGSVRILGVPDNYIAGSNYTITVQVTSTKTVANSGRNWGFELTAARADLGTGSGTLTVTDAVNTQKANGSGNYSSRTYVKQTNNGTYDGQSSPRTWSFQWTAPNPAVGRVYFFACGLAGDGTGGEDSDWVYTASDTTDSGVTAVGGVNAVDSWASIKALYR